MIDLCLREMTMIEECKMISKEERLQRGRPDKSMRWQGEEGLELTRKDRLA